jgi:hypothetical protein
VRRYRLDADSPAALRNTGQRERRRQLEGAVSQGRQSMVKVLACCLFWLVCTVCTLQTCQDYGITQACCHKAEKAGRAASMHALLPDQAGWGDDEADAGPLNPHYDAGRYGHLSAPARRNLARVDENRIDYDLLEELIGHIDATCEEGAILAFLPGEGPSEPLLCRLLAGMPQSTCK